MVSNSSIYALISYYISYTQRITTEHQPTCPKCGSEMFGDDGQKKEILRMRQLLATSDDKSSRLKDDKDQRDILFFNKQLLINFEKKHIEDAYAIVGDETSFGFEFIEKVNFKEINFGEKTLIGNDISIAGKSVPRQGFVICRSCGKVQFGKPTDETFKANHSFTCDIEEQKEPNNYFESLYLYREFNSEAIRLMLPITSLNIDEEKLHSLIASFQLGLKEYFKGSVEHLRVGIYDEIDSKDEMAKRYLILYDTVPGGTGYLKQLMRDEKPLFEVLEVALKKLKNCQCNAHHDKDGCYKCIYAYKNNFDRPLISKRKAIEIIENIVASKDNIQKVQSVSDVNSETLSESVLEELFLSKLKSISTQWKQAITTRGRGGYQFELSAENKEKYSYEIEQQVELTSVDGVAIYSKADFIIYPLKNKNMKPIVVFTDGFTYHEARVAQDSAQRMAIVKSGNFIVWSLTWEDIEQFSKKNSNYKFENYLSEAYINLSLFNRAYSDNKNFLNFSSFELLLELLKSKELSIWEKRAKTISTSMFKRVFDVNDKNFLKTLSDDMKEEAIQIDKAYFGGQFSNSEVSITALAVHEQILNKDFANNVFILHIKDKLGKLEFASWAGVLRMYNLFQFSKNSFFTTTNGISKALYDVIDFEDKTKKYSNSDWNFVYQEVQDKAKNLVKVLSKNSDFPIPLVGEEIIDNKGSVICEVELMWNEFKIAITFEDSLAIDGWELFTIADEEKIIQTLRQRIHS
jgi:DEAD/DEAH box helicase domain-containing protein